MACDVSWKSRLSKLNDENVLLKTQVDSVVQERENIKLEYQRLFNSIKATRAQHQQEVNELVENISQKTYAYGDVCSKNQDLLMVISELKEKLKTFEKEKDVNTKFDKSVTSGKLLCVTPLSNNIAVQAKKKPESHTRDSKTNMNVSNFTGVGSSNIVRRPKSKDNKSKNRVLKNTNAKSSFTYVRKTPSSVRIDSNKREMKNSNECQSNAKNRSLVHTRYNKTPYELIRGRKANVQYFYVFGSLCYPTNDRDDLGKMKPKADIVFTNRFAKLMKDNFELSMMGEMKFFLGLQIHQSPRRIYINQSQYTMELLRKHEMEKCDIVTTPIATAKIDANLQDLARCLDDYKITFGGLQFPGDKLVSWSTKKQDCTAMATAEAEYVSLSTCCAQVIWMRTQVLDYGYRYNKILIIPCSPECKIVGQILLDHPLSYALIATADVPAVVGYQGVVDKVSGFYMKFLAQPCNYVFQKKDVIQYPRFTKLIIADLMKKFPSISPRLEEDYHSIKDDIPLVSVYKMGNATVQGMLIPNAFLTDGSVPLMTIRTRENAAKVQEKYTEEEIEKMVEGEEDEDSYASKFVDSMLNDDVDDFCTRLEPESHKENPKVVDDDDVVNVFEKKDDEQKDDNAEKTDVGEK
ncbi:retrovirus-related pol polyprotein from transposon TNT 1-94 [Tanacetum coccineum]